MPFKRNILIQNSPTIVPSIVLTCDGTNLELGDDKPVTCNDPFSILNYWIATQNLSSQCYWTFEALVKPTHVTTIEYLKFFLTTNSLELPFYFYILRSLNFKNKVTALLMGNIITHPIVFFAVPFLFSKLNYNYGVYITSAEIFAFFAEVIFICFVFRIKLLNSFYVLSTANLFSWWVGLLILQ